MGNMIRNISVMLLLFLCGLNPLKAGDTITIFTPECDWAVDFCLPLEDVKREHLNIMVNDEIYQKKLIGCKATKTNNGFRTISFALQLNVGYHKILVSNIEKCDSFALTVEVKCEQEEIDCNTISSIKKEVTNGEVTLNIKDSDLWQYQFLIDGSEYDGEVMKQKEIPVVQYDLNILVGYGFEINHWMIYGRPFSGIFTNLIELKNALNEHCDSDVWRLQRATRLVGGEITKPNGKIPITILDKYNTQIDIKHSIFMETSSFRLEIPPTANKLKVENITNGCYEDIPLNWNYALKGKN